MAKRKRGPLTKAQEVSTEYTDRKAGKLAVNHYNDVADSEDEFLAHRDEIKLDGGPDAKRRRQALEDELEPSDEEVLGYGDSEDEEDLDDAADYGDDADVADDESDASGGRSGEEEEDDVTGWGSNKKDYYNADAIETEQDALDEEAEARRIQQKQRKALTEADFGFDEDEWAGEQVEEETAEAGGVVREVLPQLQVTQDMGPAERLKLLKTRYPEFEPLSKELVRLQPIWEDLAAAVAILPADSEPVLFTRYRALSGYLGSLAMYFALLSSTASSDKDNSLPMPATDLREHDIIASLEQYQRLWSALEDLEDDQDVSDLDEAGDFVTAAEGLGESDLDASEDEDEDEEDMTAPSDLTPAQQSSAARRAERLAGTEDRLASMSQLTRPRKPATSTKPSNAQDDYDSDLGDEQPLDPLSLAAKERKRKSLRFYTSQIAQKAKKRSAAGRAAGGDDDVPYRERLRDRMERLNKEAEARGKGRGTKGDIGDELDDGAEDGEGESNMQREIDGVGADAEENAYLSKLSKHQALKTSKAAAYAQAKAEGGRVIPVPQSAASADGRREIGYTIEKNKGLTPKRKKDVKNPRVKKRRKYEEKSKKLASMKPIFKGGEGRGGYGGELTGIKKGLVRSTKL